MYSAFTKGMPTISGTLSRTRAFLLLRYLLIIGTAYLLLVEGHFAVPPAAICLLLAAALASNVAASALPSSILEAHYFTAAVVLADVAWTTGALLYSGHFTADFFYIYFAVLLLAAIGQDLGLIAIGAVVICASYGYVLSVTGGMWSLWQSPSIIRLPFLFIAAAFYGYLVDVSRREHKRAEAADASARDKTEALATVSHELRTPIGVVMGWLDILLGTELTAEQRAYAQDAHRTSEALLALISNILDVAKIDAGKLELEAVPFDPSQVVEDVRELLAETAQRKGLQLVCDVHRAVPATVRGDPARVRRVITNLVANAVKFTEQGDVVVRAMVREETDDSVLLQFEVADTGVGLTAEQQARLFRPFAQAELATARRYGGTGLGLAISKKLTALMGGEMGVVSQAGAGSTFWFTARVGRESARPEASRNSRGDLRGQRQLPRPAATPPAARARHGAGDFHVLQPEVARHTA
jgi:signal transduction histidine kinase